MSSSAASQLNSSSSPEPRLPFLTSGIRHYGGTSRPKSSRTTRLRLYYGVECDDKNWGVALLSPERFARFAAFQIACLLGFTRLTSWLLKLHCRSASRPCGLARSVQGNLLPEARSWQPDHSAGIDIEIAPATRP